MYSKILKSILNGVWCINSDFAGAYIPVLNRIFAGGTYTPEEIAVFEAEKLTAQNYTTTTKKETEENTEIFTVGIIPITGVITRHGGWCSYGCDEWAEMVSDYAENVEINAIILEIDSGGGEALGGANLHRAILEAKTKKPVLVFVSGPGALCASAAYDIASHANEIYTAHKFDKIGSIGTYLSFADLQPMYEKQGVNFHEIYATESTEKNKPFREAKKGNYELLQAEIDEINSDFTERIQANRPQIENDNKVFNGKLYTAAEAEKIGLIDGIKNRSEVLERASELYKNNYQTTEEMDKKGFLKAIDDMKNAVLGSKDTPKAEEKTDTPPEIVGTEEPPKAETPENEVLTEILAKVSGLENRLNESEAQNAQLQAENSELKTAKNALETAHLNGTKPTPKGTDKQPEPEAENEAELSHNMALRKYYPNVKK